MVVPSIKVITFQDLIRSVVVYFNTGTFPREGKWFLGADIEAAPCLFCSKQSWAIKWEDVAWTCFGFVVTELSTFWLVCPVALHFSVCSRCTCLACFLLLFFPSRGCFSYCSVQFLSHVLSFLRSFFFLPSPPDYFVFYCDYEFWWPFCVFISVRSMRVALWLFGLVQ